MWGTHARAIEAIFGSMVQKWLEVKDWVVGRGKGLLDTRVYTMQQLQVLCQHSVKFPRS